MQIELKIPTVGESITEVEIGEWLKTEGDSISKDDPVAVIETEKATMELPAPDSGVLTRILKKTGEPATVGEVIGYLDTEAKGSKSSKGETPGKEAAPAKGPEKKAEPASAGPATKPPAVTPVAERMLAEHGLRAEEVKATGVGRRVTKEDVLAHLEKSGKQKQAPEPEKSPAPPKSESAESGGGQSQGRQEQAVRMTLLRRTVAKRLVEAQQNAALLTTFNEVDMSAIMTLRQEHQEAFQKKYGIKLGFLSFFAKACTDALKLIPQLNAEIRGTDIVYRNYHDIGIAVSTERGLLVPVVRDVDRLSFAQIEQQIADFGKRARDNTIKPEEIEGGTFTITNGGVFGSLLSTPLVNPPQSGILGMHTIQERPVAVAGQVVIRPMMYVALTYDHRIVDGREAVLFLRRIKENVETPARMLLEV